MLNGIRNLKKETIELLKEHQSASEFLKRFDNSSSSHTSLQDHKTLGIKRKIMIDKGNGLGGASKKVVDNK